MIQTDPTSEQLGEFLNKYPKHGGIVLSALGKQKPFVDALRTSIGMELLDSIIARMETMLPKIIDLKAKDEELIEYRVLRDLGRVWARKIAAYNENVLKVKENKLDRRVRETDKQVDE